jgi:hypothetical protein
MAAIVKIINVGKFRQKNFRWDVDQRSESSHEWKLSLLIFTNRLKVNKLHLKFNNNFKNHITFEMILKDLIIILNQKCK